ncbi:hypothetical protein CJ668_07180 [Arcobacter cryaerophilus gv. pseudocryaerophilus]|uniref:Permuted papain-like amidase YaeF/Yiix C92 family enzyme n=1 Tax=Aliarcobacter cryaerophilus TaxID=28198 RepID=A0A2S9TN87_9BACT|nr:hypothetical protein CJ668_07180 [Arcobacter cryaerophilus gv. pseudocryaerophilus]
MVKNKLFLSLIVASLLIYLASNLFEKKISKKENLQSFDLNIIKSGDIIFRKERNFLSDMFSNIDKSKYSHIAIALKVGENLKIYHIESNSEKDDLKIDTFEKFIKFASKIAVYRYNKEIDSEKIIQILEEYEKNKIEFDIDFELENDKLYCTELINDIYLKLFNENIYSYLYQFYGKQGITINGILKNKNLQEILEIRIDKN